MKMDVQIKKTVKAGNSSAVILPKSWLNKEVKVELIEKDKGRILQESLEIASKNVSIEDIFGVYLVGSYARKEEESESDIDILIISKNTDKEMIEEGIYNILIISEKLLKQKLKKDLLPIGQMIREAEPLLNSSYLESISVRVTKKNVEWYINTTEDKIRLIEDVLRNWGKSEKINKNIVYTLVLRIRTLYIIKKLIKKKKYLKKDFIEMINKISGSKNAYNDYLSVKNNLKKSDKTKVKEAKKMNDYLKRQLKQTKNMLKQ